MLKVAKLLYLRGFHITFVNREYNHKRLLKSRGPNSLNSVPSFQFVTIPDGLPDDPNVDATQDIISLCESIRRTCLTPFKNLLSKLNSASDVPPVTCIVSDNAMTFTLDAAQELGIPEVLLWTCSACRFMCYMQYRRLIDMGLIPLKGNYSQIFASIDIGLSYITNGHLETSIDWVPGIKEIRLKDMPSFVRTTDPQDFMLDFVQSMCEEAEKASAIIVNTFDALEHDVLDSFSSILSPPIYSIGPLNIFLNNNDATNNEELKIIGSNLWKEEPECIEWLDSKEPNSVVYVNFGSVIVMTSDQLIELAWGIANSNKKNLWGRVVKLVSPRGSFGSPCGWGVLDTVVGIQRWRVCEGGSNVVLAFLCGATNQLSFLLQGVGVGLEIEDVKREKVEALVRELMEGEKGKEMKAKALEWKKLAHDAACGPHGSSFVNMDNMVRQVLMGKIAKN
ncbi:7-deoxyloganetin glucosyltransferase [Spatholobus suberectus]|nr:7-deoxyloganetin glucosyltransferase [Spatholobus suberectus]